jgi:hypothetical protein
VVYILAVRLARDGYQAARLAEDIPVLSAHMLAIARR